MRRSRRTAQHDAVVRTRRLCPNRAQLSLLSSYHRRLGSVRAEAGDAERAPGRERVVLLTERRRPCRVRTDDSVEARARRAAVAAVVWRVTSPRPSAPSHRRLGSDKAETGDGERAPSREHVVP